MTTVVGLVVSHGVVGVLVGVLVGLAMRDRRQRQGIPGIPAQLSAEVRAVADEHWRLQLIDRRARREAEFVAERLRAEVAAHLEVVRSQAEELEALRAAAAPPAPAAPFPIPSPFPRDRVESTP